MKKIKNKIVAALTILLLMNGTSLTVFADNVNIDQFATEIQRLATVEKRNTIYVVENKTYKELLEKDFAIIEDSKHILVLEGEYPNKKELDIIDTAEKFYLVGEFSELFEEEIVLKENYAGNMFGFNKYEAAAVLAEENGTDKDIIIANGESLSDSLTASQIGLLEGKNVLLVDERYIPYFTGDYLEAYGLDKEISFVEGELSINQEIKEQILQFTGNEKYILNELGVLKKEVIKEVDSEEVMNEIKESKAAEEVINAKIANNVAQEKNSLIVAAQEASDHFKSELTKENKVIQIMQKEEPEITEETVSTVSRELNEPIALKNRLYDFLDRENESLVILLDNEVEEKMPEIVGQTIEEGMESYMIKVSYAKPFSGDAPEGAEVFIAIKPQIVETPMYMQPNIVAFLEEALKMKGWDYSQARRWDTGYADCSSIVIRSMIYAGVTKNTENMTTRTIHRDNRFYEIPMSEIQVGDILWKEGHMEIYMGGDNTYGAFDYGKLVGYGRDISRFSKAYRISGR
jgi:hypothetical protein